MGTNLFAQTKVDSLLFKKINEYRANNHLYKLFYRKDAYKASSDYSKYASKKNISDFRNYYGGYWEFDNRCERINKHYALCKEINILISSETKLSDDSLSKIVFYRWINGKSSKEIILDKKMSFGAISNSTSNYITIRENSHKFFEVEREPEVIIDTKKGYYYWVNLFLYRKL